MAAYLKSAGACLGRAAIAFAMLAAGGAHAEALRDPTRPVQHAGGAADPARGSAEPRLQSVLISAQRREAVIDGQTVRAGDKVGNARVVRILETEVVLREGNEVRILRMYPDVKKSYAAADERAATQKK